MKREKKCEVCDRECASHFKLVVHRRVHTGERPFKCLYCDKGFKQKGHLKCHATIHTGEKLFKCRICDQRFVSGSQSRAHELTEHLEEIQKHVQDKKRKQIQHKKIENTSRKTTA